MSEITQKESFIIRSWSIFGIRVSLGAESFWSIHYPWKHKFSVSFRAVDGNNR